MIDLNGIYRQIRPPFFLVVDCIMRWISRKLVSRRSCPSLNSSVHARTRPHSGLRDSNKGARTRRCNLMDERTRGGVASRQVAWCSLDRYHIALGDLQRSRRPQGLRLIFREKSSYSSPSRSCIYNTVLLTKFLKIVWPFVTVKRRLGEGPNWIADGCYRACIFKNRDYRLSIKSWTVNSKKRGVWSFCAMYNNS